MGKVGGVKENLIGIGNDFPFEWSLFKRKVIFLEEKGIHSIGFLAKEISLFVPSYKEKAPRGGGGRPMVWPVSSTAKTSFKL